MGKLLSIEEMQDIAKSRGGKCLSKKYINTRTKLKWKCAEGHIWKAVPYAVKQGGWCPTCFFNYSEELCRTTFEQIFKKKFLKIRPKWLLSSSGNIMELDGYCKKYNLAFEYQGEQHFKLTNFYFDKDRLKKRIIDDKLKIKLCLKHDINLFIVKYTDDLLKLPIFIKNKMKALRLDYKHFDFDKYINFNKIYAHKNNIQLMHDLALKNKVKCVSKKYINAHYKLTWQCSEGHTWKSAPYSVNQGYWCARCSGNQKYTINDLKKIAKSKNIKLLSKRYIGAHSKLKWQCIKGHTWLANIISINKIKNVCQRCAGRKKTIEDMQKIAKTRKGVCLSKIYSGTNNKLIWKCSKGHQWKATPKNIQKGTWCAICSKTKKLSIEEMQDIAKSRGGKCLSKKYFNTHHKLKWQCAEKHIWKAQPSMVKSGTWCRKCYYNKK